MCANQVICVWEFKSGPSMCVYKLGPGFLRTNQNLWVSVDNAGPVGMCIRVWKCKQYHVDIQIRTCTCVYKLGPCKQRVHIRTCNDVCANQVICVWEFKSGPIMCVYKLGPGFLRTNQNLWVSVENAGPVRMCIRVWKCKQYHMGIQIRTCTCVYKLGPCNL